MLCNINELMRLASKKCPSPKVNQRFIVANNQVALKGEEVERARLAQMDSYLVVTNAVKWFVPTCDYPSAVRQEAIVVPS